ncbi:hypothetical protein [Legionella maioricensis]|uniref:Uncharacterized protein n=1 Tax=Legionella maioricensis TaxID=2896528 RepID=A0A9X2CZR9_9GAMM|nr:hypothetical protein [Legionella maioricensis]MCL9683859.1 hypothetical protein [Legionella maioricensis]MCL9686706.1 hypothetical protein [Legionella maioricensis]
MKNSFVIKKLGFYDSEKGYWRTLFKDEPHIKELRPFVKKIEGKERDLSPEELYGLVEILLGKNTRSDSLSGEAFRDLANGFGGFAVLDLLQHNERLTADNLVFFERNSEHAKELAPLVMSLAHKINSSEMLALFKLSKRMQDTDKALFFKFLNNCEANKLFVYIKLLCLLNQHKIHIDNLVALLTDAKDVLFIHQIIDTLVSVNSGLLTATNVAKTLQLKHPYYFSKLFKVLPITQEQFDDLLGVEGTLDKSSFAEEIIKAFNSAGWELKPWLKQILTPTKYSIDVAFAIQKLREIKVPSEHLFLILTHVFNYPHASTDFAEAVVILSEIGLEDKELKILCGVIPEPVPVAKAIVILKKEQSYREETLNVVRTYPEHARGLALGLVFFDKLGTPASEACKTMLQHPECAEMTTRVLEYLRENNLHKEPIALAVCQSRISQGAFLSLLKTMKKAGLLNQSNLELLFPKMSFIKTLASAANCLAHVDKLDQDNFSSLIIDPINSLFLAKNLGGRPYPKSLKFFSDNGAKSFDNICEKAQILAQVKRQGGFFMAMTKEQEHSFQQATGKTISKVQDETLIKIASYCGNNGLDAETEHHVASTTYLSQK